MTAHARTRASVLTIAGTLGSVLLAGCGSGAAETTETAGDPTPATSSAPAPADTSASASASTTRPGAPTSSSPSSPRTQVPTTGTASNGPAARVSVYLVGDTPQGPRLFREPHSVESGGDNRLEAAAALLTSGDAIDPDYRTLFPAGSFKAVERTGAGYTVRLADTSYVARGSLSRAEARLAVQQLVYTLQHVGGTADPVRVLGPSGKPSTLFGVRTSQGVADAPQLDVLGLVNVASPKQGDTVSGKLAARGRASSFEGTVPWQILRGGADGAVVKKGFATAAGYLDRLYAWRTTINVSGLKPGDYTFVAMTDDASGGEGGGPTEDSKTFTVQ